jgi:hypothetical protein
MVGGEPFPLRLARPRRQVIALQIVGMHVFTGRDRSGRGADRHALLDHFLARRDWPRGNLMPYAERALQLDGDAFAVK